jgi:hypothetical protein
LRLLLRSGFVAERQESGARAPRRLDSFVLMSMSWVSQMPGSARTLPALGSDIQMYTCYDSPDKPDGKTPQWGNTEFPMHHQRHQAKQHSDRDDPPRGHGASVVGVQDSASITFRHSEVSDRAALVACVRQRSLCAAFRAT